MIRRLQLLLFWCFLIFPAAIVLGDFELTQWKFLRPIQIPEITSPRTVSVVIDDTVISKTVSLDFELRVVDGQSREVPFNLITDRDETGEEKRFDVTILNQGVFKSDYQQFMCDMKKSGLPVNQILLETSSHDFVRRADVDGSDDQRHWLSLAKGLHIFDWPEGRRVMMEIPDSNYRYLRVILWLDRGKPLTIEGVSVAHVVRQKGQQEPVRFTLLSKTLFTPDKYSEWIFDFGHQNPLVNRSELIINDPNFRRRVDVATSDDDKQWTAGPSLEIFRVTSQTGKDEFTRLETNALHHRYLRVRIMNGDNRPLDVKEIRFYRFLRQVVFVAEPGGK